MFIVPKLCTSTGTLASLGLQRWRRSSRNSWKPISQNGVMKRASPPSGNILNLYFYTAVLIHMQKYFQIQQDQLKCCQTPILKWEFQGCWRNVGRKAGSENNSNREACPEACLWLLFWRQVLRMTIYHQTCFVILLLLNSEEEGEKQADESGLLASR